MTRPPDEDKSGDPRDGISRYLHYSGLGITVAVYIVGGILLGHWLDGLLGWEFPVLTLVLLFLGIGGAFWTLMKEARKQR